MPQLTRALAAAALCAGAAAQAESYVAIAGGASKAEGSGLESAVAHDIDFLSSTSRSDSRGAWRVGVGHVLAPRVNLELNYSDYGHQSLEASGTASPAFVPEVLGEHRFGERKVTAWGVDIVLRLPLSERVAFVARGGPAYATVKWSETLDAPGGIPFGHGPQSGTFSSRDRTWAPRVALGVGCTLAGRWDADLTLEHLGRVGRDFASGTEDGTGRSSQTTGWLGVRMRF